MAHTVSEGLSIVLLFYNEEDNAEAVVRDALRVGRRLQVPLEIVLVDDGSRDGTAAILDTFAATHREVRVVRHDRNQGYGAALLSGLRAARERWVFYSDGDGQFDLDALPAFLDALEVADVVVGYRQVRADAWPRRWLGVWWSRLTRMLLGLPVRDVNCAFKVFPRSLIEALALSSEGALIDAELLAGVCQAGAVVAERPVPHRPRRAGRASGAELRVIVRALRELAELAFTPPATTTWVRPGKERRPNRPPSSDARGARSIRS